MSPYAEHLGIIPPEFDSWKDLVIAKSARVILVEGALDKLYIDHLRETYPDHFKLPKDVEVVPYDGKDALKNTTMMKFVLSKMASYFVTFDLDAAEEATKALTRIGLVDGKDFMAVGINKPGRKAIEGLLPEKTLKAVHGSETETIMAVTSTNPNERNAAKASLKRRLLEEFKSCSDYAHASPHFPRECVA